MIGFLYWYCNSRACFTSEKCNVPDGIRSLDPSHFKPPAELKEISTNAVSRCGYEPTTFPITLGRSVPATIY